MQNFDVNVGSLVASDTQETLRALDEAILSELKLCTTLVEAIQGNEVPISASQKILASVTSGLSQIVAGRGEMATAVRHLTILKQASNLAVYDYGCPNAALSATKEAMVEQVLA